ncbi:MAG: ADP-ribosylation factor-like protein [Thermoanaerobaculia bacterium]
MVVYNAATRELTARIVYYGPGLGGKTTNLHLLHDRLDPQTVGKLLNLATQTDRTIYFDLLPVELGDIKGYKIRFQLATVPGQTAFNEARRVVLRGADGIVFVADSQWSNLPKNLESWQNLKENLKANAVSLEGIPVVVQYNKRDLPDILSVDALQEALGLSSYPFVEAVASAGRGVTETFKLISKLTFVDLLRRLQGRKPEDAAVTYAKPAIALVPPAADEPPFGRLDEGIEIEGPIETAPGEVAAFAAKVQALEDRIEIEARRQRGAEDDVAMALRNLAERGEKLHQLLDGFATQTQEFAMTVAALATRVGAVENALQEKTSQTRREADDIRSQIEALQAAIDAKLSQGRREAEDIRAQIAPLLEAKSRRTSNEQAEPAEVDRLRESLADSLADLSERLRRAVRGL